MKKLDENGSVTLSATTCQARAGDKTREREGHLTGLTCHYNGQEITATRRP